MKNLLKLIRAKHWIKNLLVFLPLIFSKQLFNIDKVLLAVIAFFAFSFMASSVYIINDLKDLNRDRLHSVKKKRPLAAGIIKKKNAIIFSIFLIILSFLISISEFIISNDFKTFIIFTVLLLSYFILNILYSFGFKNIPIVDVVIIVYGFLVRVFLGAVITNIPVSNFLYLTMMTGAFFMGFGKRRNEIIKSDASTRTVLNKYNKAFLDKFMYICLTLTIVFYSMWCIDTNTIVRIGNDYIIWSIPLLLIILMKYSLNIEGDSFGDPVDVVLKDKTLVLLSIFYAIIMGIIIYVI